MLGELGRSHYQHREVPHIDALLNDRGGEAVLADRSLIVNGRSCPHPCNSTPERDGDGTTLVVHGIHKHQERY